MQAYRRMQHFYVKCLVDSAYQLIISHYNIHYLVVEIAFTIFVLSVIYTVIMLSASSNFFSVDFLYFLH